MRVIIHFGQPRTGTTSLQQYLSNNTIDEIYYPKSPEILKGIHTNNHFLLSICSLDDDRYNAPKLKFLNSGGNIDELKKITIEFISNSYEDALKKNKQVLIFSSEDLYFLNNESEFIRLKSMFSDIPVPLECICCFREKKNFKKSWMGRLFYNNYTLNNNLDDFRCVDDNSSIFNYEHKQNLMKSNFDNSLFFNYKKNNIQNFLKKIEMPFIGRELKYNQSKNYIYK